MVIFENVTEEDVEILLKHDFTLLDPKTVYEEARLQKNGVTVIVYTSGKLQVQGKKERAEKIAEQIEKLGIGKRVRPLQFRKESGWIIGSDETLKGDTFGGLVVAAVKADEKIREKLIMLGVADSKKLADKEMIPLAEKIKNIAPCEIKSILPEEYNKEKSITTLLNRLHKQVAADLNGGKHIVDKYPGCKAGDIAEEKAESKYVEVAAASILARATGLKQLDYLSMKAGFHLPKGSTHVRLALQELKERQLDFRKFVKLHFSNVQEILK